MSILTYAPDGREPTDRVLETPHPDTLCPLAPLKMYERGEHFVMDGTFSMPRSMPIRYGDRGWGVLAPFVWRRPLPRLERGRRLAERRDRPIMLICGGARYGSEPDEDRELLSVSPQAGTSFPWYEDQSRPEGNECG